MDGYTGKKVVGGLGLSRSSGLSSRDVNQEDRSFKCCNRIGCSTRQGSIPSIQNAVPEKPKFLKPPFRLKNSNCSAASSSRSFSSTSNFRKYYHERQNQASLKDVAESSNRHAESGENLKWESEFHGRIETKHLKDYDRPMLQRLSTTESSSGSNVTSASRYGKQISRRLGSAIQDTASSFLRRSSALRCATQVPKTSSPVINSRQQRYNLNNLGCASISDVLPSDSSSGNNTRGVSVRRRLHDGEGSSKAVLAQPERQVSQEASRQTRIQTGRDIAVSVRSRHGSSGIQNRRMRLNEPEYESIQLADPLLLPQPSHVLSSAPQDVLESSQRSFSSELPSVFHESSFTGRPGTGSRSSETRLLSGSEDREDYRRFNIEGIAEILLALERIEQDEELTDEQLLVLEANLFLGGGLSFYDQHREMRLDIDNMSYEELLALEEEMGTVSTALSEEAISKCLKRSTYRLNLTFPRISRQGDDVKCSICQEEYVIGEEMGSLPCEHRFHVECIRQWLRLKNWCPICKAAAASFKNKPQS